MDFSQRVASDPESQAWAKFFLGQIAIHTPQFTFSRPNISLPFLFIFFLFYLFIYSTNKINYSFYQKNHKKIFFTQLDLGLFFYQ